MSVAASRAPSGVTGDTMSAAPGAAMGAAATGAVGLPRWTTRLGPWFLVGLHLSLAVTGPTLVIPRHDLPVAADGLVVLLALAICALQLRHSFAAARGQRPAGGPWTFLAVAALVYVPMLWFTWNWSTMPWFVVASAAMTLRGRFAAVAVAGPIVGETLAACWSAYHYPGIHPGLFVMLVIYYLVLMVMGSTALYASARLVRVLDDLYRARTEMAELAVGRERLRVSRDLHDLLGQSLSAISLKGDLALRLLRTDSAAACAEIESLTGVARGARRDVGAVARNEHAVSLTAEVEAAAALLDAAGIATRVDVDLPGLTGPVEQVLAWTVREGATNALRHSEATTWSVTAARQGGRVTLEIVNDGAPVPIDRAPVDRAPDTARGSGLAGLAQRARAVSGSASAVRTPDGHFRLHVDLPGL